MRKLLLIFSSLVFIIACSANSDEDEEKGSSGGESQTFEATIEDVSFILPSNEGEFDIDGDTGFAKMNIMIKNKSKQSIDIFPDQHMVLYDEDVQIDPSSVIDVSLGMEHVSNTSIGGEKQKDFNVIFEVEREKSYKLNIEPLSFDPEFEIEAVSIDVDMAEYSDSYEVLEEPVDVVEAYIETVFMDGKVDDIDLDESLDVDISEQRKSAQDGFITFLEDGTYIDISNDVAKEYYDDFIETLNKNVKYDVTLKGNSGKQAIVEVDYEALSSMDLYDDFDEYRQEYLDDSSSYDTKAADEYALSKLDVILKKLGTKQASRPLEVYLQKNDEGQWKFLDKIGDPLKDLQSIFAEGKNY